MGRVPRKSLMPPDARIVDQRFLLLSLQRALLGPCIRSCARPP